MTTATERKFANQGVRVGSVFLMQPSTAIKFVEQCKSDAIAVLGVEGFKRIGDAIQPQQEHSCDFESANSDMYDRTIEFLSARLNLDIWFEVVTDELHESVD